jgi:hypothetical protein
LIDAEAASFRTPHLPEEEELMKLARIILGASIGLWSLALTACPQNIPIGKVSHDPGRYFNKEVTVTGHVTNAYGALGQGVYEIDDGTGRIWVFTEKYGVPSKGEVVSVTGRIVPGITYEGRNYATVLRETRRRRYPNR